MHVIAAKAVCFGEALKPEFKEYAKRLFLTVRLLQMDFSKEATSLFQAVRTTMFFLWISVIQM